MLNLLNPYPSPEAVTQLPEALQFVFTPVKPTQQDIVLEKIQRARELRDSFFGRYRVAMRLALEFGQSQEDHHRYFAAYQRAHRLVTQLRHRL